MVQERLARRFWLEKIKDGLNRRSVLWLAGIRRVGKTFLVQSIEDIEYFDCELPRIRNLLSDPESFLNSMGQGLREIALDEIHRLDNPSEILKIAADHYPHLKVIATGSSTLGAAGKFKDSLTGRKSEVWLTPMVMQDQVDFGNQDILRRMLRGGLPPFFLAAQLPEQDFQEWMDAYWAKDIQELFRLERRHSFQKFAELLMQQSGGAFEASRFAAPCEISRTTVSNYLSVLEATYVVHLIRPFSTRKAREIIAAPKVYGMDTGFVAYHRGWYQLRTEDMGILWEHLVLNELHANLQSRQIQYWRDKHGHEVDFVLRLRRGKDAIAVECKWSSSSFDPGNLKSFRHLYPNGENYVVSHDVLRSTTKDYGGMRVTFVSLTELVEKLTQVSHGT